MFELSGTVKQIFEEKTFGSGFNVREFGVTTEADKYPQDICLQCVKEKIEMVNQLKEGEKVKVITYLPKLRRHCSAHCSIWV